MFGNFQRVRMDGNGWNYEFDYDSSGGRVSVWQGNTRVQGQYYAGGAGVGYYANGMTRFQHKDWLGTERIRTRPDGSVEGRFYQGAFGYNLQTQGSDTDGAHFAGQDADTNSGTSHAQFRQLDIAHGKWMSPDPFYGSYDLSNPQSLNRYSYALNNPLALVDPAGLYVQTICTGGEGAYVDGVLDSLTETECFTLDDGFGLGDAGLLNGLDPPDLTLSTITRTYMTTAPKNLPDANTIQAHHSRNKLLRWKWHTDRPRGFSVRCTRYVLWASWRLISEQHRLSKNSAAVCGNTGL